jgi:hypothetical protein
LQARLQVLSSAHRRRESQPQSCAGVTSNRFSSQAFPLALPQLPLTLFGHRHRPPSLVLLFVFALTIMMQID